MIVVAFYSPNQAIEQAPTFHIKIFMMFARNAYNVAAFGLQGDSCPSAMVYNIAIFPT